MVICIRRVSGNKYSHFDSQAIQQRIFHIHLSVHRKQLNCPTKNFPYFHFSFYFFFMLSIFTYEPWVMSLPHRKKSQERWAELLSVEDVEKQKRFFIVTQLHLPSKYTPLDKWMVYDVTFTYNFYNRAFFRLDPHLVKFPNFKISQGYEPLESTTSNVSAT